ncbi:unnamed protein product [Symbiodinium microadriaticum]|nr:unnamed protein product [Symbiodinium microadriaticum]
MKAAGVSTSSPGLINTAFLAISAYCLSTKHSASIIWPGTSPSSAITKPPLLSKSLASEMTLRVLACGLKNTNAKLVLDGFVEIFANALVLSAPGGVECTTSAME